MIKENERKKRGWCTELVEQANRGRERNANEAEQRGWQESQRKDVLEERRCLVSGNRAIRGGERTERIKNRNGGNARK